MEGTVKWFNRTKGFGFIQGEDGTEYFVHHTQVAQGTFLRDNDRVSFEAAESDRGMQARNVTLLQKGSELGGEASAEEASEEQPEEEAQAEEQPAEAEEKAEEAPQE